MYSRVLRSIYNASVKLKEPKNLKKFVFLSPNVVVAKQQQIHQYVKLHTSSWNFMAEEVVQLPRDTNKRKAAIDAEAQKEIDSMMEKDPEIATKMKVYEMEISMMKYNGENVPEEMRPIHWLELLKLNSRNQRKRYLSFLFIIEKKNENRKKKKLENSERLEKYKEEREDAGVRTDTMVYGVGHNSLFRRITDKTMNQLWNWNCIKATVWGNKIIFDLSYEQYMKPQEVRSCAKQILESYAINRLHTQPFDIYLCNVNFKGQLFLTLLKFIPSLMDNDFPWTITSKSFIEIFDKKSLVYLTGHANEVLQTYDPQSIYIIGGFVDKTYKQPVSLAKAKELNIRRAKLPIDQYLHFGDGSNKNLTLNQVVGVMLDAQIYDWNKAMEHVPRRKLMEHRIRSLERKMENEFFRSSTNDKGNFVEELKLQSSAVFDLSHSARVKLRSNFQENKKRKKEEC